MPFMSGSQNFTEFTVANLPAGQIDTVNVRFYIAAITNPPCMVGDMPYTNFGTIQSANDDMGNPANDIDSNPGSGTPEEFGTIPNTADDNDLGSTGNGDTGSEDDHDPANIDVFDLALTKMLNPDESPYTLGETATFEICVTNQGNVPTDSVNIIDYIPLGYSYATTNDAAGWTFDGTNATIALDDSDLPGGLLEFLEQVCVTIDLIVENPMGDPDNYINIAEITSATTVVNDGMGGTTTSLVTSDNDGTFDDDPSNDPGGEVRGSTDDTINSEGGDEDDADPATIEIFDLALIKTLNTTTTLPIVPGGTVVFDLDVFNQGTIDGFNIQLSDYIPAGLSLSDPLWTPTAGVANLNTPIPSIAAGDSMTVTIEFTVDADFMETSITNNSEIESAEDVAGNNPPDFDSTPGDEDGSTPDGDDNDTDDVTGGDDYDPETIPILQTFDLALTKTLNSGTTLPIVPGGTVIFDLEVFNQGTLDAFNIQLSDYTPTGLALSDTLWADTAGVANLITPIARLDAGDSTTVTIEFTVDADFMETSITNNAEIESQEDINGPRADDDSVAGDQDGSIVDGEDNDTDETNGDDDYDPETIPILQTFDLALTKTLNSGTTLPIVPGGTVIYDLEVFNQGTLDAFNIQLSDYTPTGLTLSDTLWTETSGVANLVTPIARLDAGESTIVQITYTVDTDFMETSITNNAEIESQEDINGPRDDDDSVAGDNEGDAPDDNDNDIDETNGEDDYDPEVIMIVQNFDVALRKEIAEPGPFGVGDTITFAITVLNQGTLDATDVEVTEYVPTGMTNVDPDWSGPVFMVGTVPAGDSVIVEVDLKINDDYVGGSLVNNAEITNADNMLDLEDSDSPISMVDGSVDDDSELSSDNDVDDEAANTPGTADNAADADDYDPAFIEVVDMALEKQLVTAGPYAVGDTVEFAITVHNQGSITMDSVVVNDYVPAGYTFDASGTNSEWSSAGAGIYQTTLTGGIAPTATATVNISLIIEATTTPSDYVNVAELSSFQDEDGNDRSDDDTDSMADDTPGNDAGGEPGGDTDDTVDGENGDEDDSDPAFLDVVDFALTKVICLLYTSPSPRDATLSRMPSSA